MKLPCIFLILVVSSIISLAIRNRSNCGVTSIYFPSTGTRTPLITFISNDSRNRYEFTVISNKNKNNFKVQGPVVYRGIILSNLDSDNEWYLIKQTNNENIEKIKHSYMFNLCKQLHQDNSKTNFYTNHNLSKRFETENLPINISINVITAKTSQEMKKSSFLQVKDIFDDDSNLLQKNEIKNELTSEDNFEIMDKKPVIENQDSSFDASALQATIKKELGVEKVSYKFDD